MTTRCGTCDARVIWTVTTAGKRMPVNADPVPNGNIRLSESVDERGRKTVLAYVLGAKDAREGVLYVSHLSTCPQAAQHRRK